MALNTHHLVSELRSAGKPRAVEGVLDIYLIRPGGFLVAKVLHHTPVSPHLVSLGALLAGWATAYFLLLTAENGNDPYLSSMAAVALLVHSFLDSADGQLARLRGTTSEMGRIIDGISDYLTFAAVYLSIGYGLWVVSGAQFPTALLISAVAGISHAIQCIVVEYQRNLYKHYVHGAELPAEQEPQVHDSRSEAGNAPPPRIARALHSAYSALQQFIGGSSLQLSRRIALWRSANPDQEDKLARVIRSQNRNRLRVWALIAPNSHKVGMIVGAFLPVSQASPFGNLGLYWYFLYVIVVLNLLMLGLLASQRNLDKRTWQILSESH